MASIDSVVPLLKEILSRISLLEGKLGSGGGVVTEVSSNSSDQPLSIKRFDIYTAENLDPFISVCVRLGGDAALVGGVIKEAWLEMRKILLLAAACKEPSTTALPSILAGVSAKIKECSKLINRNEWEKHTKTCSEGISSLNWLVVKPAPRDFIESTVGGSDYWANNIRKEFRNVNADQIAFCDTFKALLVGLMAYVKEFHTTGLSWNAKGVDVAEYSDTSNSSGTEKIKTTVPSVIVATAAVPKGDLFAALNKDSAVTSGLKKVTKDMQTWRSEYKTGDGPTPAAKSVAKPATTVVASLKGPAKLEFQAASSKWLVEYQTAANGTIDIAINDKKETVYIYGCVGATVDIKGKCKSIIVDGCKQVKVYFDSAMASCEVVNCQRMQVHCREVVPAVAVDKTDGIVVFLPSTSLNTEIVASKSSEMNVTWPDENGDLIERPIPEQYVHRIKGTTVTADVSDLYSH